MVVLVTRPSPTLGRTLRSANEGLSALLGGIGNPDANVRRGVENAFNSLVFSALGETEQFGDTGDSQASGGRVLPMLVLFGHQLGRY